MNQEHLSGSARRLDEALVAAGEPGRIEAIFGSTAFFRLWIAQVVSATGDWLGLFAVIALADRLVEGSPGAAIASVLVARIAPGIFLATAAGVIVDRFNRKRVMLTCDITRALVLFSLPFVDSLMALIVASFVLEICTMLWSPAKEAVVPNLVPTEKLTAANSLNVAAAYGMFPVAAGLGALLAKIAEYFSDEGWVNALRLNQEGLAFYVDGLTFLATALIISTIAFPRSKHIEKGTSADASTTKKKLELGGALRELREGWRLIAATPIIRAVNVGLAVGVIGGGALVPLGALFVEEVIRGDEADLYLIYFALGLGMALGVITATILQNRISRARVFPLALLFAGVALFVAGSSSLLGIVVPAIGFTGYAVGPVYVLGFTLLHEHVDDEFRGRIFAALLVLVRFCFLVAIGLAAVMVAPLDALSNGLWEKEWNFLGMSVAVPGVRLTMWLSAITVFVAGILATKTLRSSAVGAEKTSGGEETSEAEETIGEGS